MENRPPQQETPRRPPNPVRKPNGSGGPPTPPWLWLIVIGLLALIFWHFVPKTEVEVPYFPWFTEQVDKGNIKTISIQGNDEGPTFYDAIGGHETFEAIVSGFYARVANDELLVTIYPDHDWAAAAPRLRGTARLAWRGGPAVTVITGGTRNAKRPACLWPPRGVLTVAPPEVGVR